MVKKNQGAIKTKGAIKNNEAIKKSKLQKVREQRAKKIDTIKQEKQALENKPVFESNKETRSKHIKELNAWIKKNIKKFSYSKEAFNNFLKIVDQEQKLINKDAKHKFEVAMSNKPVYEPEKGETKTEHIQDINEWLKKNQRNLASNEKRADKVSGVLDKEPEVIKQKSLQITSAKNEMGRYMTIEQLKKSKNYEVEYYKNGNIKSIIGKPKEYIKKKVTGRRTDGDRIDPKIDKATYIPYEITFNKQGKKQKEIVRKDYQKEYDENESDGTTSWERETKTRAVGEILNVKYDKKGRPLEKIEKKVIQTRKERDDEDTNERWGLVNKQKETYKAGKLQERKIYDDYRSEKEYERGGRTYEYDVYLKEKLDFNNNTKVSFTKPDTEIDYDYNNTKVENPPVEIGNTFISQDKSKPYYGKSVTVVDGKIMPTSQTSDYIIEKVVGADKSIINKKNIQSISGITKTKESNIEEVKRLLKETGQSTQLKSKKTIKAIAENKEALKNLRKKAFLESDTKKAQYVKNIQKQIIKQKQQQIKEGSRPETIGGFGRNAQKLAGVIGIDTTKYRSVDEQQALKTVLSDLESSKQRVKTAKQSQEFGQKLANNLIAKQRGEFGIEKVKDDITKMQVSPFGLFEPYKGKQLEEITKQRVKIIEEKRKIEEAKSGLTKAGETVISRTLQGRNWITNKKISESKGVVGKTSRVIETFGVFSAGKISKSVGNLYSLGKMGVQKAGEGISYSVRNPLKTGVIVSSASLKAGGVVRSGVTTFVTKPVETSKALYGGAVALGTAGAIAGSKYVKKDIAKTGGIGIASDVASFVVVSKGIGLLGKGLKGTTNLAKASVRGSVAKFKAAKTTSKLKGAIVSDNVGRKLVQVGDDVKFKLSMVDNVKFIRIGKIGQGVTKEKSLIKFIRKEPKTIDLTQLKKINKANIIEIKGKSVFSVREQLGGFSDDLSRGVSRPTPIVAVKKSFTKYISPDNFNKMVGTPYKGISISDDISTVSGKILKGRGGTGMVIESVKPSSARTSSTFAEFGTGKVRSLRFSTGISRALPNKQGILNYKPKMPTALRAPIKEYPVSPKPGYPVSAESVGRGFYTFEGAKPVKIAEIFQKIQTPSRFTGSTSIVVTGTTKVKKFTNPESAESGFNTVSPNIASVVGEGSQKSVLLQKTDTIKLASTTKTKTKSKTKTKTKTKSKTKTKTEQKKSPLGRQKDQFSDGAFVVDQPPTVDVFGSNSFRKRYKPTQKLTPTRMDFFPDTSSISNLDTNNINKIDIIYGQDIKLDTKIDTKTKFEIPQKFDSSIDVGQDIIYGQDIKLDTKIDTKTKFEIPQKFDSSIYVGQDIIYGQDIKLDTKIDTKYKQEIKLDTKIDTKYKQEIKLEPIQPQPVQPEPFRSDKPKPEKPEPKFKFSAEKSKDNIGYKFEIKVGGKFISPSEKVFSKKTALAKASEITGKTALRSFRLKPVKTDKKNIIKRPFASFDEHKFYKKKSGTFVEKSKFAIDTPGEKKEITKKGLMALRTKNSLFSKKKKKSMFGKKQKGGNKLVF